MAWKDFFSETSAASMTRLLSFVIVSAAMLIQLTVMYLAITTKGQVINNVYIPVDTGMVEVLNYSTLGLLSLGLGAKVAQKYGEKSNTDITPKQGT
jgi:hypothetical protein